MKNLTDSQKYPFIVSWFSEITLLWSNISSEIALFVACQFALESAFGSSSLARKHNNICGMRKPLVRPSTAISNIDSNGFACYNCKYDCLIDYMLCITYHKPLCLESQDINYYKSFIGEFYCLDKDYVSRIENIFNQYSYLLTFQN